MSVYLCLQNKEEQKNLIVQGYFQVICIKLTMSSNMWNQNNPAGGFIYFNKPASNETSNTPNTTLDTSEYLSFDSFSSANGSYQNSSFSPSNYSSPRNFVRHSPMGRSPRNYYSPIKQAPGGKNWRRNLGLTANATEPNHPNNNYNQQQNHHQNRNYSHHHKRSFGQNASGSDLNSSKYFDATCLTNPWLELEQKLFKEQEQDLVRQDLQVPDAESQEECEESGSQSCGSSSSSGSDDDGSEEGVSSFS
ncbi:probable inactive serine/threonine-protein kinase scy2 [Anthonomus grandis grandis]|uniref:probable inactive serine/threonine-protein kinase scy2 n=1 Tax=Anthonomus grandis grandis TaxID=2921223 RepID=UPI002165E6BF|nr:probable inactive serine/threonine-protein kinase scy2 [Anthonomus grandis grandis]